MSFVYICTLNLVDRLKSRARAWKTRLEAGHSRRFLRRFIGLNLVRHLRGLGVAIGKRVDQDNYLTYDASK